MLRQERQADVALGDSSPEPNALFRMKVERVVGPDRKAVYQASMLRAVPLTRVSGGGCFGDAGGSA